jgi:hypothetical protein
VILLWLARNNGWQTPRFLTYRQAQEAGGYVRAGSRGTKVYFIKQLLVKDDKDGDTETRVVPKATLDAAPRPRPLASLICISTIFAARQSRCWRKQAAPCPKSFRSPVTRCGGRKTFWTNITHEQAGRERHRKV